MSVVAKPLDGYIVLDLTIARAGPTAVRLLSDWGANVIRIEAPQGSGDFTGSRNDPDSQNLHRERQDTLVLVLVQVVNTMTCTRTCARAKY